MSTGIQMSSYMSDGYLIKLKDMLGLVCDRYGLPAEGNARGESREQKACWLQRHKLPES